MGLTTQANTVELEFTLKIYMQRSCMHVQVCVPLPPWAMRAGAREKVYFDPRHCQAAIVTCGGLCPGLNDVVQGIVKKLEDYGVPEGNIHGIKYAILACSVGCVTFVQRAAP